MSKVTNGGNLTQLYALALTSGVMTPGASVINLNQKFTTQISGHEKAQNLEASLTHDQFDSTWTSLTDTYSYVDTGDEYYEDASPASVDETKMLLSITYGAKNTAGLTYVKVFPCIFQGGGFTYENKKSVRPEAKLKAIKVAGTAIAVPTTAFDASKIGLTAISVPAGSFGTGFWAVATGV